MSEQGNSSYNLTVIKLLQEATAKFAAADNTLARRDADLMLAHVLSIEPISLPLFSDTVSAEQLTTFREMIERRLTGEPVAYIVGEQGFWSLDFYVNEHTLIPRPDTELLVEIGLQYLREIATPSIADLGSGSGCILLSILLELRGATGLGVDLSAEALKVAQRNANRHGLEARARFIQSDWFAGFEESEAFDLIVSNPPYIPVGDIGGLMKDVRNFEPVSALDGGADGLDCYRHISRHASSYLAENGHLAFEVGAGQSADVCAIMEAESYADARVFLDLAGISRAVIGKKPQES